jgi:hypothetical protein
MDLHGLKISYRLYLHPIKCQVRGEQSTTNQSHDNMQLVGPTADRRGDDCWESMDNNYWDIDREDPEVGSECPQRIPYDIPRD